MQTTEIKDFNWNGRSGISKVEGIDIFSSYLVRITKHNTVTGIAKDMYYSCETVGDIVELQANVYEANAEAEANGYVTVYTIAMKALQSISAAKENAIKRQAEAMVEGA